MSPTTTLKKIPHDLQKADRIQTWNVPDGKVFIFRDGENTSVRNFQINNPLCPAPENTLGAIKIEKEWFWVIQEKSD